MNKVIAIHLHGTAFQLEEGGYETLRAYLDNAARQLGANPDKAEILADIEQAIADKFVVRLKAGRNVVLTSEVEAVIAEVGQVDSGPDAASADPKAGAQSSSGPQPTKSAPSHSGQPKRLYRITEGAMISGVCNGLAAYVGIDVTLLRLAVVLLACFSFGTLLIVYIVARFVIPEAKTPEEKAATSGPSQTAHDFVRMAREGYYEGTKSFRDRHARREWKRKFRHEMRDWKRSFRWERWAPPPCATPSSPIPPPEGYTVALPILSTIKALLTFVLVFAIVSLIATGSVFGLSLPGGLPVWAGVILLILAYNVVVAPIKAMRRACYFRMQGQPYFWHPFSEFFQFVLTLCIVALSVWLADHFIPAFHEALLGFPEFCRHAGENIQQWWNGHGR